MIESTLASGAVLKITPAPFRDASVLWRSIMRIRATAKEDMDIGMAVFVSEEVENAMFKCAERATYAERAGAAEIRVTRGLFDDGKLEVQVRKDYLEICKNIIEVNCEPFLKPAFSESSATAQASGTSQP